LGKKRIAHILARAGLQLGTTTVGRILASPPIPPPSPEPSESEELLTSRTVTAKYPDHVWHMDLTAVPTRPGFSREEQTRLSQLVLAHRRSLRKVRDQLDPETDWTMVLALRLAALFLCGRSDIVVPVTGASASGRKFRLNLERDWLARNPLTVTALRDEIQEWEAFGFDLNVKPLPEPEPADLIPA
jgi:hypothetical protein